MPIERDLRGQALLRHRRHRLPRHRPGRAPPAQRPRGRGDRAGPARAPGRRRRPAGPRGDQERLLRPPARRARRRASTTRWPAGCAPWPATWAATGSASTTRAGRPSPACDVVIHSAATVSFDAPLTQPSRSTCSAPPAWPRPSPRSGRAPTSSRCRPPTWPARTRARPRRSCSARTASPSTSTWEDEVASARRLRDDLEAESRTPERLREFTKKARSELGAAGDHLLAARAEKLREDWVSERAGRRPARPVRSRSAGPTPTPSPRRWASGRSSSSGKDACPSPSCGRRSSSRRWPSPARAGSAASAWPSRSSSPTPGACCASSPASPRASSTSSPSTWWWPPSSPWRPRGPSPGGRRCTTWPRACGTRCATGASSTSSTDFFQRNPLYDDRGQPIIVPEWSFPGRGRVQRQLRRADTAMTLRGEAAHCPADPGQAGAAGRPDRGPPRAWPSGPWATSSSTAPTPRPRRATGSTTCSSCGTPATPTTRHRFGFDPAVIDWDRYVHEIHLPSVVEHARVRTKPGKSVVDKRPDRPAAGHPVAGPAPGRLRPRAHPHGLQRGRLLRLAGQPPPVARASGLASSPTSCARRRRSSPSTGATGATSCALLPPLRGRAGRPAARRTRGSCSTASS